MEVRRTDSPASRTGLRRRQLVELEDLPWWPAPWRDAATGFIALALRLSGHAKVVAERIDRFRRVCGEDRVLDLGSGGGGPMATMAAAHPGLRVHLTDLHPNQEALARVAAGSDGRITFSSEPVDATRVPADAPGLRTMVNAFHHLPPALARSVLQDAVDAGRPICVVEVVSRTPLQLLGMMTSPVGFSLSLPLQRPFRPSVWAFTYLLPVVPAFVLWDGLVSWLRIYSPDELESLVRSLERADGWTWEIGTFPLGDHPVYGVYLEGRPMAGAPPS